MIITTNLLIIIDWYVFQIRRIDNPRVYYFHSVCENIIKEIRLIKYCVRTFLTNHKLITSNNTHK